MDNFRSTIQLLGDLCSIVKMYSRIFISIAAIGLLLLSGCDYLKETDPESPNFNPKEFRFSDYSSEPSLKRALEKLFPIGTNRNFVEDILVDHADYVLSFRNGEDGKYYVGYQMETPEHTDPGDFNLFGEGRFKAEIHYDKNDNVIAHRALIIGSKRPGFLGGERISKGEKL